MSQDAIQHKGVAPAPLYIAVPCEDSTYSLAFYMVDHLDAGGSSARTLEILLLRWLVDNNMVICKRN